MYSKPKKLVLMLLLILMPVGCVTKNTSVDSSCLVFEPITYSVNDTKETRRQIVGHNAAYDIYCEVD